MSSISKILFILTQIIIAILTQSVESVFYGALAISILLFLIQFTYLKVIYKDSLSFSKANINTAKSLMSFGGWSWLSSLTYILKAQSDKWIVSGLLGLKTFGLYSIGILVFNQLHTVISASILWVFPHISKNNKDKQVLAKQYWKLLFYIGGISLTISIVLVNFRILFELWLGENFYQQVQHYVETFLLLLPIFTMSTVAYFYLSELGLVKHKFFADIFSLVVKNNYYLDCD
ncbi:hypothetical protein SPBRAN_1383 [uncultured Candidatus Thioglobus sp.]|nr:hypothetical protein SPBRAN_1383 [uncultured Candidatus Thioglobus sp.]